MINNSLYFIEFSSSQMEGIMYLHEHILSLILGIFVTVLIFYKRILYHISNFNTRFIFNFKFFIYSRNSFSFNFIEQRLKNIILDITKKFLEILWTIIPAFILVFIAGPSFALLYSMDEMGFESILSIIVQGSQWYWTYEYFITINDSLNPILNDILSKLYLKKAYISSYLKSEVDLSLGQKRLLDVTIPLQIPYNLPIRFLITSNDVLHSWAIPSLGLKVDAVPGRLNQLFIEVSRKGFFFGQCSEICGVNHGFMPIALLVTDFDSLYTQTTLNITNNSIWENIINNVEEHSENLSNIIQISSANNIISDSTLILKNEDEETDVNDILGKLYGKPRSEWTRQDWAYFVIKSVYAVTCLSVICIGIWSYFKDDFDPFE